MSGSISASTSQTAGRVPASRIAWSTLRGQFDANLARFEARTGLGDAVRAAWHAAAPNLQLLRLDGGRLRVFGRAPGSTDPPGWLPGPAEAVADESALRAAWAGRVIRTLAVNGVGLGAVVPAVVAASHKTFLDYSPRVIVIEPSLVAWAVVFHLRDWSELLRDARVRCCAGPAALEQLDAHLGDVERLTPLLIGGGAPWPGSPTNAEVLARIEAAETGRVARQAALFDRVQMERAAPTGPLASTPGSDTVVQGSAQQLSILGITSRYTTVLQYTMRDLLAAFAAAGHATHLIIEADEHAHFSPIRSLEAIERVRPDLVVLIDHTQREFASILPDGIPVATWVQDQLPHLFSAEAGAGIRPREFVFGHGFPECLTRFGYPPERFLPCRIPTNPASLLDPHESDADLDAFRCDVMFATNATSTPQQIFDRFRARAPDAARPLLDAAAEELRGLLRTDWFCGDYDYASLLARCEQATGREITHAGLRAEAINCLRGVADQTLRERVVRWAIEWADATGGTLHLFGRGWSERPEFARFARGFVPHGPLLGRAFRAARVSLHAGVNPALHQRVIDGLCAGGFFLIAEKPFDTSHEISCAILDYYERERPALPFNLTPDRLPPEAAAACARAMLLRGVDPNRGASVDADELLNLRMHCEHRLMHTATSIWPRYAEVVFHGREQFFARLDAFVRDTPRRQALAAEMRAAVLEHFTYDALVRRLVQFVRDGLAGRGKSLIEM